MLKIHERVQPPRLRKGAPCISERVALFRSRRIKSKTSGQPRSIERVQCDEPDAATREREARIKEMTKLFDPKAMGNSPAVVSASERRYLQGGRQAQAAYWPIFWPLLSSSETDGRRNRQYGRLGRHLARACAMLTGRGADQ